MTLSCVPLKRRQLGRTLSNSWVGVWQSELIWPKIYVRYEQALSARGWGWFNTNPCCSALTPTQHVFGTAVNVHAKHNSMHKTWNFTILKQYFHCKNVRRIQIQLDKRVPMTVKLRPIKSKVNSPLKITNYFSFKFRLSHSFQWLLLAAATVEI